MPPPLPEAPQRAREPLLELARCGLGEVIEGGAEVVVLGLEPVEPPLRISAEDLRMRLLGEGEVPISVPAREPGIVEMFGCELTDRLQHPKALAAVAEEALVDERLERVQVGVADLLRCLQGGAADKDGHPSEQPPLVAV